MAIPAVMLIRSVSKPIMTIRIAALLDILALLRLTFPSICSLQERLLIYFVHPDINIKCHRLKHVSKSICLMPLAENWERNAKEGIIRRITGNFRRERPLKERIERATKEIKILNTQLNNALSRIKQRDKAIFSRVISAVQENDKEHASIYANELSELRRLGKFVSQAQLALELILLRLETVLELGELTAKSLAPSVSVLKSIQGQVVDMLPEAKKNVEDLFTILMAS